MNTKMDELFGLSSMEGTNQEAPSREVQVPEDIQEEAVYVAALREIEAKIIFDEDHSSKLDALYDEVIEHSRNMMDLAYNADPRSQRGMFEVATAMYRNALDAKNSKRSAQVDLLKHTVAMQKLEMERLKEKNKAKPTPNASEASPEENKGQLLDRNALLRDK